MFRRSFALVALLAVPVTPVVAQGRKVPAECQPLIDAMRKQVTTPHHSYTTEGGANGKARSNEAITADGVSYLLYGGTWRKSPIQPKGRLDQIDSNLKTATTYTCQHLADQSVGGTPASVYRAHAENQGVKSDSDIWIAKGTGLMLKQEEDVDTGDGIKRHLSMRFEYTGVQAPAGVK